jgi:heat shock protein HslJ
MKAGLILFTLALVLSAGAQQKQSAPTASKVVDMHNSQNSLDWAGVYEGTTPCADCPGIKTRLTLNRDGTYELMTQYLERPVAPATVRGRFTWHANGNEIVLDAQGGNQAYAVGEGRLFMLSFAGDPGSRVPNAVLTLVPRAAVKYSLPERLERYRWTLASATDGKNQSIDPLRPNPEHPVVLTFSGGNRLSMQAPCNRIVGGYQIRPSGQLALRGAPASTMMGCEPALMRADSLLSSILLQPLTVAISDGPPTQLSLRSPSNATLTFTGAATPEALYGAGTTIFLEVAPQRVACEHPPAPSTRCLSVRDIHFDEHGLRSGTPGAWRPLQENIQGFTHEEGVRNVLRVKRYDRGTTGAGASSNLYVLDLVVESHTATP